MDESIVFINRKISDLNIKIERDIDNSTNNRGCMSQNIIKSLRDFVEYIAFKVYVIEDVRDYVEYNHVSNGLAIKHIKSHVKHSVLKKFHNLLEIGPSHNSYSEDGSVRLMVKYQEYLVDLKKYYFDMFNDEILSNLYKFPIYKIDQSLVEYYKEVYNKIKDVSIDETATLLGDSYYINKTKPIVFNDKLFYELTLTLATDFVNKSNRIIFYSPVRIPDNYAVKISYFKDNIKSFNSVVEINIINNYEIFIRPCEINNLYKIFGIKKLVSYKSNEYDFFMKYLTRNRYNLNDVVNMSDNEINNLRNLTSNYNTHHLLELIELLRKIILNRLPGVNTLKYLIYMLRNSVVVEQLSSNQYYNLSNLCLKSGCRVFEEMPYASSLVGHNISMSDLIEIISPSNRKYEIFARRLNDMCNATNRIYFSFKELGYSIEEGEKLVDAFNSRVYVGHPDRILEVYGKKVYIKGFERSTLEIIKVLKEKTKEKCEDYDGMYNVFEVFGDYEFTDIVKQRIAISIYKNSKIGLIYGSAGTGKTEMIKIISKIFEGKKIAFLAKTNAALNNIKLRVGENFDYCFSTVDQFVKNRIRYDLVVIDECSMVENSLMIELLEKCSYDCLLLVGDIYQIEAIKFGNWFRFAKELISECSYELSDNFRTTNNGLKKLWSKVRTLEKGITEKIVDEAYTEDINESIFDERKEGEIVLCLNYDGPFGINNINRYLQLKNPNEVVEWGINTYKVGDPVIFSESRRFSNVLYNNLKGKIVSIEKEDDSITFQIYVDHVVPEMYASMYGIKIVSKTDTSSIIEFQVFQKEDDDKDDQIDNVVPFSVSYATSIHKAQGLEFESVKIIISDESEELITKSILYTAITRTKNYLKIYWSAECQNNIIKNISDYSLKDDLVIILNKNKW